MEPGLPSYLWSAYRETDHVLRPIGGSGGTDIQGSWCREDGSIYTEQLRRCKLNLVGGVAINLLLFNLFHIGNHNRSIKI